MKATSCQNEGFMVFRCGQVTGRPETAGGQRSDRTGNNRQCGFRATLAAQPDGVATRSGRPCWQRGCHPTRSNSDWDLSFIALFGGKGSVGSKGSPGKCGVVSLRPDEAVGAGGRRCIPALKGAVGPILPTGRQAERRAIAVSRNIKSAAAKYVSASRPQTVSWAWRGIILGRLVTPDNGSNR